MSKPKADLVRLTESLRLFVGKVMKNSIIAAFAAIEKEAGAKKLLSQTRVSVPGKHGDVVTWSLWIGRNEPTPTWYAGVEIEDRRHLFALMLECQGYVGIASSLVGDVRKHFPNLKPPTYQSMIEMRNMGNAEFRAVRAQRLGTAQAGVHSTTTVGRSLERTMARSLARRSVPAGVRFTEGGAEWRIAPLSGQLAKPGGRVDIPTLCEFFSDLVHTLKNPPAKSVSILDAYAQPQDFSAVGNTVVPMTLRFDASIVDAYREGDKEIRAGGTLLSAAATSEIEENLSRTWDLVSVPGATAPTWNIRHGGRTLGTLVRLKKRFGLRSAVLNALEVKDLQSGETGSLGAMFNQGELPYLVAFSDPRVLYLGRQLFRDDQLLGEVASLIAILDGSLPSPNMKEKTLNPAQTAFDPDSLFGYVEAKCASADFLVLEDMSSELADYISVEGQSVTYWHGKGGSPAVGASGLHEVVGQALKNLSAVRATQAEFQARAARWADNWQQNAAFPRLRRGTSVPAFLSALHAAMTSANYRPRVVLVVGGLQAGAMKTAMQQLAANGSGPAHVTQALWLLSMFVDACKEQGAEVRVVCEP